MFARTFSLGFSWEKLPPQRVMRGHPENYVRTLHSKYLKLTVLPFLEGLFLFQPKILKLVILLRLAQTVGFGVRLLSAVK